MKILIVSLHVRDSAQAVPLAAGNLMAALPPELQRRTRLLDLFLQQPEEEMLASIHAEQADLVAFSLYLWNRASILRLAAQLKQLPRPPFLLLGGPEASADSHRLLLSGSIDSVLRGEGEESFARLAQVLAASENPGTISPPIAGLCIDPLRAPADACACDIERLASPWLSRCLQPVAGGILWEVARGCPFDCSFCYDAKGMAGVRPLPLERLAAELEFFVDNGAEQVWVLDSTFNAPQQRGRKLLKLLLEKAPQLHYHLEAKAEFIDSATIDLLRQLSCSIQLGLQSADSEVLSGLNRRIDPQRFWGGVELLADSGLTFGLDLIYGLPNDSPTGFRASLERALGYRPNQVEIFPLAILPGTRLYQQQAQFALTADTEPPYLLRQSADFSSHQMHACALLAAAVDLFYNHGRAVGFLLPFCSALQLTPLHLLEAFRDWFLRSHSAEELLRAADNLANGQILALQQEFVSELFTAAGLKELLPLCGDILDYHYQYAEALLGEETLPTAEAVPGTAQLRLAPGVRLIDLRCDILGALESEEIDLPRWLKLVDQSTTCALMIRRGGEILCELLDDEFAALLRRAAQGVERQLLGGDRSSNEVAELLDFALREGILLEKRGVT